MNIRKYNEKDCDNVAQLFFETVHCVNAKDYTSKQLFAWASDIQHFKAIKQEDLISQNTIIAEIDGKIVGFGSITGDGCLDLLFVDKDYQGKGIATALCDALEEGFEQIVTYASVTAKPFFEKRGYVVLKSQEVERNGEKLKNYKMKKQCLTLNIDKNCI